MAAKLIEPFQKVTEETTGRKGCCMECGTIVSEERIQRAADGWRRILDVTLCDYKLIDGDAQCRDLQLCIPCFNKRVKTVRHLKGVVQLRLRLEKLLAVWMQKVRICLLLCLLK